MAFSFSIPTLGDPMPILANSGESIIFVGANGGGKTRLAVRIEEQLGLTAHRISAHRALTLNPEVAKITENLALKGLQIGRANKTAVVGHRQNFRWSSKSATKLLNDFDFLLQALFADQSRTALETHKNARSGNDHEAIATKFEQLQTIWERLLPHRKLHINGDDINVSAPPSENLYSAAELSDGERAIFYMVGQSLAVQPNSLILVDEPELHIHPSILCKLWDEIEAMRPDCSFVFITHDLAFASSRNAQKFVIKSYTSAPSWELEPVPVDTGFNEELVTLILGSRAPILFVEGNNSSLDSAIYRACYPDWTIVGRGSCDEVFHSVVTLRKHSQLTRIHCTGLIDADDHNAEEQKHLDDLGIKSLKVSEVENLILLPSVSREIAIAEGFSGQELEDRLRGLKDAVFKMLDSQKSIDNVVARYCRRRIDRQLKKIDLSDTLSTEEVKTEFASQVLGLDIDKMADEINARIAKAIEDQDLPALLSIFDNKGLIPLVAKTLKNTNSKSFEGWLIRVLGNEVFPNLIAAIQAEIPEIPVA